MPIYNYKCKECGKKFSKLKGMSERGSEVCECGGRAELQLSTFTGHLRGDIYTKDVIE